MADGTAIDPEFLEEDLSFDDGWRDPANVLVISDTSIHFVRLSRRGRSDIVIRKWSRGTFLSIPSVFMYSRESGMG